MPLLDRVTTLIKANLNDLIEKAEDPEKLLRQLLLDMQNQYMQVKTQLALSLANYHLLERRVAENKQSQADWVRRAELALAKNDESLARQALEQSLTFEAVANNFAQQLSDQSTQVQQLKDALHRLEQKMVETRSQSDLLISRHRRARVSARSGAVGESSALGSDVLNRMRSKIALSEAEGFAAQALPEAPSGDAVEAKFAALEKSEAVDRLLSDLKSRSASA